MKLNKREIRHYLYEKDVMRRLHDDIVESFVGCLRKEYIGESYPFGQSKPSATIEPNIFPHVVNMFTGIFMSNYANSVIDAVTDIIVEAEYDNET